MLIALIFLESRRVTIYEMERMPEIEREIEEAQAIADANAELAARKATLPRVQMFDARGKLAAWEEGRR